jgi:hypothetical protein
VSEYDLEEYDKALDPKRNTERTWLCFNGTNCHRRKAEQEESGDVLRVPKLKERSISPNQSTREAVHKSPIPYCKREYASRSV